LNDGAALAEPDAGAPDAEVDAPALAAVLAAALEGAEEPPVDGFVVAVGELPHADTRRTLVTSSAAVRRVR
jgi:hypothetical protein